MKEVLNPKDLTPAMKQFMEIKGTHPDSILFFRMGDFYEMFFEDAVVASKVLGIALTSRDKGREIPMCGFPFHASKSYIAKLINSGYKVAVCEQVEEAGKGAGKGGLVKRAVTKVITPGTAIDEEILDGSTNNFIAAATWDPKGGGGGGGAGFAYMDVTTGEFLATDLNGAAELLDELKRINPAELLLPTFLTSEDEGNLAGEIPASTNVTVLGDYEFDGKTSSERLRKHFKLASLDGFGLADAGCGGAAVKAAGALLQYVKDTQKAPLGHVTRCTPYFPGSYLVMDHTTTTNLEILTPLGRGARTASLASLLDKTMTSMGARRLKQWLTKPLIDAAEINSRLEAVGDLIESKGCREDILLLLEGVFDLERLIGRVSLGAAGPRDLVSLKQSLWRMPGLKVALSRLSSRKLIELGSSLDSVEEAVDIIDQAISDRPPALMRDGGAIKDGYNKELDELRSIGEGGKDWIARLEKDERKKTGIQTLKVGYNKVFGYFITVTKANAGQVPESYIRKQTLVNAERYITPELKEWEAKILGAEERIKELESRLFAEVVREVSGFTERIQRTASIVSVLDVLTSFAVVSEAKLYVKPTVNDGTAIIIDEGRHPIVEEMSDEPFIPNDIRLDTNDEQIIILTGPNMAGKSTYIRQVALIVCMAQAGCFVPASAATIGVADRIFTRVGASDDLSRGQSTFMVEMSEAANILNNATERSLVILDEIGRGTSTFDGLSIAWAVAEYIHDEPAVRARTLFATHYHELTELSLTKERVKNYNMAVKEWNERVVFLRKVVPGGTNRSYGIQVARLSGMPADVIERAGEILKNLERGELNEQGMPRLATGGRKAARRQMNLPTLLGGQERCKEAAESEGDPVRERLERVDLENTTPIEALEIINNLKKLMEE